MHIDQTGSGTERGLYVYRNLSSGHTDGELLFVNNDNSGDDQPALRVKQDGSGDILVLDDDATRVMTVKDGGNVGIGTTVPSQKLEVSAGNIMISGSGGAGVIFKGTTDGSNKNALYFLSLIHI